MKKFNPAFTLLVIVLLAIGCQKNPVDPEPEPEVLIPLTIGNQWLYQRTGFDSTGEIRSSDTIVRQVEYDTTFIGETWLKTSWGYVKNKEDGVWYYYSPSSNVQGHEYATLTWPYPGEKKKDFRPLATNATITLIATDAEYTTPTGTFQCYHYRLTYDKTNGYQQDYYIQPGIGFVKWEDGITLPSGKSYATVKYELLSYTLK